MASVVSREAYFETGLDVRSDLGYGGLKLAEECNRLGVTTGSFCHYFPGWPASTRAQVWHRMPALTVQVVEALVGYEQATLPRETDALEWTFGQLLYALDSGRFASVRR